jgi:hypothetical protein
MTTATNQTLHIAAATATTGLSWKTIVRRIFEQMGKQYAHSPNML